MNQIEMSNNSCQASIRQFVKSYETLKKPTSIVIIYFYFSKSKQLFLVKCTSCQISSTEKFFKYYDVWLKKNIDGKSIHNFLCMHFSSNFFLPPWLARVPPAVRILSFLQLLKIQVE